jgi:hypothetical protein
LVPSSVAHEGISVKAAVGAAVIIVMDEVRDPNAGSVVVASCSPRADILDACDCNAAISVDTLVFSQRLRRPTSASSSVACVSMPPFSMA